MALATEIFRDYVTDGVPSSGVNAPVKSDIRAWGTAIENGIRGVHNADIPSATTLDLSDAAGELVDVTGTTAVTAITLDDGNVCTVRFTGALTLTNGASLVLPGAADILTVAGDFAIFRGYAAGVVRCVDYSRNDGKALVAPSTSAQVGAQMIINATIVESHAANAVTYALKTLAGADPSSGDPVKAYFRNSTPGTGNYVERSITAALSLTVSSGSTLGASNGVAFKPWLVLFDDAGTVRLGIINNVAGANVYPLGQFPIASSTAEGGAGAADSAQVFYTGTAISAKPYIPLGYASYESGLAAAGTWGASPTRIQMFGPGVPLPGTIVQSQETAVTAVATGTTTTPQDDTIPQNTEGTSFLSQSITPTSAANLLDTNAEANLSVSSNLNLTLAMYQGTGADAIAALNHSFSGTGTPVSIAIHKRSLAATTSAVAMTVRAGCNAASTVTINGISGSRNYGGAAGSFIKVDEIMT